MFAVGQRAIAPLVVISALHLGASPARAALVVAAGLGQIVADLPAGAVVHRYGRRAGFPSRGQPRGRDASGPGSLEGLLTERGPSAVRRPLAVACRR